MLIERTFSFLLLSNVLIARDQQFKINELGAKDWGEGYNKWNNNNRNNHHSLKQWIPVSLHLVCFVEMNKKTMKYISKYINKT